MIRDYLRSFGFSVPSLLRLLSLCLLLLCGSCTHLRLPGHLSDVALNMQLTRADEPGLYTIAGETNLPKGTQLTVAALRYLSVDSPTAALFQPVPTYSILAYETAKVSEGKWQTQLNLWQVAADGKYQETWQLEQKRLGLSLKPSEEVVFITTLAPIEKLSRLEQQLSDQGMRLARGTIRTSADGQRYAQINQVLAIALPTGDTVPPAAEPTEVNYGWGERYIIPQEPQNPYDLEFPSDRQTNAPPRPDEFLQ